MFTHMCAEPSLYSTWPSQFCLSGLACSDHWSIYYTFYLNKLYNQCCKYKTCIHTCAICTISVNISKAWFTCTIISAFSVGTYSILLTIICFVCTLISILKIDTWSCTIQFICVCMCRYAYIGVFRCMCTTLYICGHFNWYMFI